MKLLLATRNRDKLEEIEALLGGLGLVFLSLLDFPQFPEVVEDGETFEENAIKKAKGAFIHFHVTCLADDSGLEVEELGGAPGVYSSRFAGEGASYQDNNSKLLQLLKGVPLEKRLARFRCVVALVESTGEVFTFEGISKGHIALEPRGDSGFGYDPLFVVPELGMTFAQLGQEKKNQISHRARALAKVREYLKSRR